MPTKAELRQHFKTLRANISEDHRLAAADEAAKLFVTTPIFSLNQKFACYLPVTDEFDSRPILAVLFETQKQCYLPVLDGDKLVFVQFNPEDELIPNRFGILEPPQKNAIIPPDTLDVVILPLLAFDPSGHRLGMGGGFFDKTFAFMHDAYYPHPYLLGLGFQMQEAPEIPVDSWDVTLDGMLTEEQFFRFIY